MILVALSQSEGVLFLDYSRGLGRSEQALRSAIGGLDRRLGASELGSARGVSDLGSRLSESEARLRATTGGFDPRMTGEFYDPFEQAVVQQTIEDVLEGADQADIAQRARDIQTGGESAFGSRARLTAAGAKRSAGSRSGRQNICNSLWRLPASATDGTRVSLLANRLHKDRPQQDWRLWLVNALAQGSNWLRDSAQGLSKDLVQAAGWRIKLDSVLNLKAVQVSVWRAR